MNGTTRAIPETEQRRSDEISMKILLFPDKGQWLREHSNRMQNS